MALLGRSFHWRPNPDGTEDGHYPNGDKNPQVAVASWGDLSALATAIAQLATGSAFSQNVRQYLTGSGSATATLSVATVSGDDAASNGWAISTDNLTNPGSTIGSGFLKLGATIAGNTVYSSPISWSWIAAAPTDILAPPIPTGLSGNPVTNGINWSWDAASDPHDGTTQGSGTKEYDLELNGTITVVPGSLGITSAPTITNIGSISSPSAPTATQSGRNWTLTAAGTGIDGTSDQCLFVGWAVSGNCRITAKVFSFAGTGNIYAPAGVMIREDLTAGSKYAAAYQWLTNASQGVEAKQRVLTGGSRASLGNAAGSNSARWLRIDRNGDTFTMSYSTDGMAWTQIAVSTISMNSTVYIGGFTSSMQAGSQVVAALNDLNPSTLPSVTYAQSTTSPTVARVRARDISLNTGTYSPLTQSVTPIVSSGSQFKWHPGFYIVSGSLDNYATVGVTRAAQLPALSTNVKGFVLWVSWRGIETSRGVYNWTALDSAIADLKAKGLRYIIQIQDRTFSGGGRRFPDYLTTEPNGDGGYYQKNPTTPGYSGTGATGTIPKLWNQAIMDRYIALYQAISDRYDSDSMFEGIRGEESDIGFSTGEFSAANFSSSGYLAQLLRLNAALSGMFPHTLKWVGANFLPSQSQMVTFATDAFQRTASGIGVMGSDLVVGTQGWAQRVWAGQTWNGSSWVSGGTDWRGIGLYEAQIQDPEMGGKAGNFTPLQFYNEAFSLGYHHQVVWDKNYAWSNNPSGTQTYWDSSLASSDSWRWKQSLAANTWPMNSSPTTPLVGHVNTA